MVSKYFRPQLGAVRALAEWDILALVTMCGITCGSIVSMLFNFEMFFVVMDLCALSSRLTKLGVIQ